MFTGLIEKTGILTGRETGAKAGRLTVKPETPWADLEAGESIAVNGACLTFEKESGGALTFFVMKETLDRTNLGQLKTGSRVNLERALSLGSRLGGHLVSGHVDAAVKVVSFGKIGDDYELRMEMPSELRIFFVTKGSVCVNGVSLTLTDVDDETFAVRLIPTTRRETNLDELKPGDLVNIETDLIGKYVCEQLRHMDGGAQAAQSAKAISMRDLTEAGF
ncbi:MAG: riboflavin synthase [Lentisphaeria bacterium]|nr:riboflavin synthase [Lentisphaeria bacterium]